jgi:hypothetical protein
MAKDANVGEHGAYVGGYLCLIYSRHCNFVWQNRGEQETIGIEERLECCVVVPGFVWNWYLSIAAQLGDKEGYADSMSSHH